MSNEKQNPDCPRCALGDGSAIAEFRVKYTRELHLLRNTRDGLDRKIRYIRSKLAALNEIERSIFSLPNNRNLPADE